MYKQIIIARKDLNMSAGKLAAQVSHASMAFLTEEIKNQIPIKIQQGELYFYHLFLKLDSNIYEQWLKKDFTKCILKAKNKNHLLKAVTMAEEIGLKENEDFFLIRDNCYTELVPEENSKTLTCIGFKPMKDTIIDQIGKKFRLYT